MYEFFQSSKLDGSYFLLFCLSIVIVMKINDSRNNRYLFAGYYARGGIKSAYGMAAVAGLPDHG